MNILPKKRWHVRTKDNIARVRRDEAEAAEKERQEKLRIDNADREARLNILKQKRKLKSLESGVQLINNDNSQQSTSTSQNINFFTDIEHAVNSTNKEHEKEEQLKKEEYEKKIGYLTYLGQDTNEALKKKNWYEVLPNSRFAGSSNIRDTYDKLVLKDADGKPKHKSLDIYKGEQDWKLKQRHDPIIKFKKYCKHNELSSKESIGIPKGDVKVLHNGSKKKHKKDIDDKNLKLHKLREARLKREQQEKFKTEMFLSGLNKQSNDSEKDPASSRTTVKPKYNSQFNPELARQNYR